MKLKIDDDETAPIAKWAVRQAAIDRMWQADSIICEVGSGLGRYLAWQVPTNLGRS